MAKTALLVDCLLYRPTTLQLHKMSVSNIITVEQLLRRAQFHDRAASVAPLPCSRGEQEICVSWEAVLDVCRYFLAGVQLDLQKLSKCGMRVSSNHWSKTYLSFCRGGRDKTASSPRRLVTTKEELHRALGFKPQAKKDLDRARVAKPSARPPEAREPYLLVASKTPWFVHKPRSKNRLPVFESVTRREV